MLADILTESRFDADELGREKNVIIQEIGAVEDTPDDLVFDLFTARGLAETADRSTDPGHARRRQRASIAPRSTRICAATIAPERRSSRPPARSSTTGSSRAPRSCSARLGAESAEPPQPAAYRGGEILVKKKLEQTHIVVGFEGRAIKAADHDAAHVFAAATGGGMSSRLFQEVRERRGLAYSIYTFHWAYSDSGLFGFYAGAAAKDAGELMAAALDCLGEAAEAPARGRDSARQGAVEGLDLDRARIAQARGRSSWRARRSSTVGRSRSKTCWRASTRSPSTTFARRAPPCSPSPPTVAAIGGVGKALDAAGVARRLKAG